jgi:putative oxidoreductase
MGGPKEKLLSDRKEKEMIDDKSAPYGALLLRVSMGVLFLLHGLYLKAFVFGMAGTGKYFVSLGLPDWFAWVVMLYETIGGVALILGVFARWVAVFLGVHLLFAAYLGHGTHGWLFTAKGGGYEYPVFWAVACFTLGLLGSGAYALKSDTGKT